MVVADHLAADDRPDAGAVEPVHLVRTRPRAQELEPANAPCDAGMREKRGVDRRGARAHPPDRDAVTIEDRHVSARPREDGGGNGQVPVRLRRSVAADLPPRKVRWQAANVIGNRVAVAAPGQRRPIGCSAPQPSVERGGGDAPSVEPHRPGCRRLGPQAQPRVPAAHHVVADSAVEGREKRGGGGERDDRAGLPFRFRRQGQDRDRAQNDGHDTR